MKINGQSWAIYPGTTNDIAKTLGISRNIKKQSTLFLKAIRFNMIFVGPMSAIAYVAAAGTFTSISYTTKQKLKGSQ